MKRSFVALFENNNNVNVGVGNNNQNLFSVTNFKSNKTSLEKNLLIIQCNNDKNL